MIAEKGPYIRSAYDQLQVISQDKQKRMEYEAREKAIRDYNQGIFEAVQRGETQQSIKIAKKLIAMGYPTEQIMQITNLPAKQIDQLR